MIKSVLFSTVIVFLVTPLTAWSQIKDFVPVTEEMLLNPSPDDWLMFSRTYDNQRFSPLDQINKKNVKDLRTAWVRGLGPGSHETIPIVYRGVLYVVNPSAGFQATSIQALDATNGDLIWEYRHNLPADAAQFLGGIGRAKNIAIFEDLVYYATPDGYLAGLDARTGELRWKTMLHDYKTGTSQNAGPLVVEGMVMTGRSCSRGGRRTCFISANDARTGKEVWKFYAAAGTDDPGGDSWGSLPEDRRMASAWGLPGAYDPVRRLIYWGIGNPHPHTRLKRHDGDIDGTGRSAPADLYSNSTVALNPDTGKLVWYYQHLPGDDWDADHVQERILIKTPYNPDPGAIKWINPGVAPGQEREIIVTVGEAGGIWALDRDTGKFLWATPFPYDTPDFHISHIDVDTGITHINWDKVLKKEGDRQLVCFHDTKSYWPMAYNPVRNSLYIPYHDQCTDITAVMSNRQGDVRKNVMRPGADPNAYAGIAKVDMATGKLQRFYESPYPGNGAMLATAGDLIFWGDMNRRLHAFDADTGEILWESIVGATIQMSTITYQVNGKQYIAVLTGDGGVGGNEPLSLVPSLKPVRDHNAVYVFALPD